MQKLALKILNLIFLLFFLFKNDSLLVLNNLYFKLFVKSSLFVYLTFEELHDGFILCKTPLFCNFLVKVLIFEVFFEDSLVLLFFRCLFLGRLGLLKVKKSFIGMRQVEIGSRMVRAHQRGYTHLLRKINIIGVMRSSKV